MFYYYTNSGRTHPQCSPSPPVAEPLLSLLSPCWRALAASPTRGWRWSYEWTQSLSFQDVMKMRIILILSSDLIIIINNSCSVSSSCTHSTPLQHLLSSLSTTQCNVATMQCTWTQRHNRYFETLSTVLNIIYVDLRLFMHEVIKL